MEAGSSPFPFRPSIDEATPASDGRQQEWASSHAGTPAAESVMSPSTYAIIQAIMPGLRRVLGRADLKLRPRGPTVAIRAPAVPLA